MLLEVLRVIPYDGEEPRRELADMRKILVLLALACQDQMLALKNVQQQDWKVAPAVIVIELAAIMITIHV